MLCYKQISRYKHINRILNPIIRHSRYKSTYKVDHLVIGAGVVGLAVGAQLSTFVSNHPDRLIEDC